MTEKVLFTRRFEKETYKFVLVQPDFKGETGILGIEINPYIYIETPLNSFGYPDYINFNKGTPYTSNRYCPMWIKKACKDAILKKGYEKYIL